jgi:hypothetical protein
MFAKSNGEIRPIPQVGTITTHTRKQTNYDRLIIIEDEPTEVFDFIIRVFAHDFDPNTTANIEYASRKYKLTMNFEEIRN